MMHGVTALYPLAVKAHMQILSELTHWPAPNSILLGALSLGSASALLFFYRHDIVSIIASTIRCLITWSKPNSLDERMIYYIALAYLLPLIIGHYLPENIIEFASTPVSIGVTLIVTASLMLFVESRNKLQKNMSHWNFKDSLWFGLYQSLIFIPGAERQAGAYMATQLLHFYKEAAFKFILLSLLPLFTYQAYFNLNEVSIGTLDQSVGLSKLSFWIATAVSFFVSLLSINYMTTKGLAKGILKISIYRVLLGIGFLVYSLTKD